jgi:hypothetical protein
MVLRRQVICTAIALLALSALGAAPLHAEPSGDSNAIHGGPCSKQAANRKVTLEINPKPVRHMQELTFRISVEPAESLPQNLVIDLTMPGMMMGKNQVLLSKQGPSTWSGKGLIVKCRSGRTLWQAQLLSPALGNPAFTFNVRD